MPNLLKLFFQDLAAIPIIRGREDYAPLIRRVQWKMVIRGADESNRKPTDAIDSNAVLHQAKIAYQQINQTAAQFGQPSLDLGVLANDIDPFFNTPTHAAPSALSHLFGRYTDLSDAGQAAFIEQGWRCFYLISLLPPALRRLDTPADDQADAYIRERLVEADEAQKRLVEGTLRYVVKVARSYIGRGLPYLDLVQEGIWGLWRATETFKEYVGAHFQLYAATWIHQRIARATADQHGIIRIPIHLFEKFRILHQSVTAFRSRYGRSPSMADIQVILGQKKNTPSNVDHDYPESETKERRNEKKQAQANEKLAQLFYALFDPPLSLERDRLPNYKQGGNKIPLPDLIVDASLEDLADIAWLKEALQRLSQRHLDQRAQRILSLRFGLNDHPALTLEEVGERLGVTRERIRQIEVKLKTKLYRALEHSRINSRIKGAFDPPKNAPLVRALERLSQQLSHGLHEYDLIAADYEDERGAERRLVDQLIRRYVEDARGQNRRSSRPLPDSMKNLLTNVLENIGHPAHYGILYDTIVQRLGRVPHFNSGQVYRVLFYGSSFRNYGNGIFGLAQHSDERFYIDKHGNRILTPPPQPDHALERPQDRRLDQVATDDPIIDMTGDAFDWLALDSLSLDLMQGELTPNEFAVGDALAGEMEDDFDDWLDPSRPFDPPQSEHTLDKFALDNGLTELSADEDDLDWLVPPSHPTDPLQPEPDDTAAVEDVLADTAEDDFDDWLDPSRPFDPPQAEHTPDQLVIDDDALNDLTQDDFDWLIP